MAEIQVFDGKTYIPNWFTKEHFEDFMGKKLTDEQYAEAVNGLDLTDAISELVSDSLNK